MPAGANHFELDPAGCLLGDRHLGDAPAIPSAVDVIALGQEILGVGKQVATLLDDPSAPARPPVSSSAVASRITSRASGRPARLRRSAPSPGRRRRPSRRVRRGRRVVTLAHAAEGGARASSVGRRARRPDARAG